MRQRNGIPSYRLHRQSGQAIVTLPDGFGGRRDVLLGSYGSQESKREYHRLVAEWETNGRRLPTRINKTPDLTVNELILAYWKHVESYYVKDGQPTSEPDTVRQALRFVQQLYWDTPAKDFGPMALKAVRDAMAEHPITRKVKVTDPTTGHFTTEVRILRQGLSRRFINQQISRIRQMFAWAVAQELLPAAVHEALRRVAGLRKGKGQARESPPVKPVPEAFVEAILPHVPTMVRTMISVQRLSGCRPQDIVQMRPIDIDMTAPIWEYRPERYKTEHHEEVAERTVFLGPQAQALLKPNLPLNVTDYIFCPRRSEEARNAERREHRKSPMTPSQARRQRERRPRRAPRDRYDVASYRRAIRRGCQKADVTIWTPHQLRHSAGTAIRKRYGLEASQVLRTRS